MKQQFLTPTGLSVYDEEIKKYLNAIIEALNVGDYAELANAAQGIIESNNNSLMSVWAGTKVEYDAIAEKDPNCFYIVTDENPYDAMEYNVNKVTVIDDSCTDEQYPSAKAVYDVLGLKANMSDMIEIQMLLGRYNTTLTWSADGKVCTETWTYNGNNYREVLTEVSDTQYTKELFINDISVGLWTMTIDEANNNVNTVYTAR